MTVMCMETKSGSSVKEALVPNNIQQMAPHMTSKV